MSRFYAQLNKENICIGVSQLSKTATSSLMVALPSMDISLVGRKYNEGVWGEVERVEPPLTDMEQTLLEVALQVEYLTCLQELNS